VNHQEGLRRSIESSIPLPRKRQHQASGSTGWRRERVKRCVVEMHSTGKAAAQPWVGLQRDILRLTQHDAAVRRLGLSSQTSLRLCSTGCEREGILRLNVSVAGRAGRVHRSCAGFIDDEISHPALPGSKSVMELRRCTRSSGFQRVRRI
jgi:hypothetical protein